MYNSSNITCNHCLRDWWRSRSWFDCLVIRLPCKFVLRRMSGKLFSKYNMKHCNNEEGFTLRLMPGSKRRMFRFSWLLMFRLFDPHCSPLGEAKPWGFPSSRWSQTISSLCSKEIRTPSSRTLSSSWCSSFRLSNSDSFAGAFSGALSKTSARLISFSSAASNKRDVAAINAALRSLSMPTKEKSPFVWVNLYSSYPRYNRCLFQKSIARAWSLHCHFSSAADVLECFDETNSSHCIDKNCRQRHWMIKRTRYTVRFLVRSANRSNNRFVRWFLCQTSDWLPEFYWGCWLVHRYWLPTKVIKLKWCSLIEGCLLHFWFFDVCSEF